MNLKFEFPVDSFRMVRVGANDVKWRTDDYLDLRRHVLESEEAYPGIAKWFDFKVSSGLRSGQRTGFVGLLNEKPVAAAIIKRGAASKFCHLKIDKQEQGKSLGDLFFLLMSLELRHHAKTVHFTLPESLWESKEGFFRAYAFGDARRSERQYRLFDTELHSQTSFSDLFSAARRRIPRLLGQLLIGDHSLLTGGVLALNPVPLEKILCGQKSVEVRTRFSSSWEGQRFSLYGTAPISGLAGEATVSRVIAGNPQRLWDLFGHAMGCTKAEYDSYIKGRDRVFALILSDIRRFSDTIPLAQLSQLLGLSISAPQSYLSLANNDGWLSAVALAAALQGAFRFKRSQPGDAAIETRHSRSA